jgi:hypothetical protein
MTKEESTGLLRAAEACGLEGDDLQALQAATHEQIDLEHIDLSGQSGWEQALTYAFACWLAQMDGSMNSGERASLAALGQRLGLPELKLKAAASAAFDIACLPGGHKPERYDLIALEERLATKLPSLRPD